MHYIFDSVGNRLLVGDFVYVIGKIEEIKKNFGFNEMILIRGRWYYPKKSVLIFKGIDLA